MAYNAKTDWKHDDNITEDDVNRWEQGIADAHEKAEEIEEDVDNLQQEITAHQADNTNPHNVTSEQVNRLGLNAFTQDAPISDYDLGDTVFYASKEKWPIIGSAGSGLNRGVVETLKTVSPSWGIQRVTEHGNTGSSSIIGDVWVRGIGTNSSGVDWGPWRRVLTQDDYDDFIAHKAEIATSTQLGHVKAGNNITIDADGTINAKGGNVDSVNGKTGEVVIDVRDIAGLVSLGLALGNNASAAGSSSTALGTYASAEGTRSVALGSSASATSDYSVALGRDTSAEGIRSVALGDSASATSDYSVALGSYTSATARYSVALGPNASAENTNEGILGGATDLRTKKWKVPGDFTVSGTKNFEIPHPKPEKSATHVIRHGAVESPTPGDTLYRWRVQASKDNDLVTIDLPDYFIYLNKDVQIWVTGQGHFGNGYGTLNRETEQLEIHCQYAGDYNVLVIGTRNDDHPSIQEWDIKGVEREIGESWTGEIYAFSVDEIMEVEEIKGVEE